MRSAVTVVSPSSATVNATEARHSSARVAMAPPWTMVPREVGKPWASAVMLPSSTSLPASTSTMRVPMFATIPVAAHSLYSSGSALTP